MILKKTLTSLNMAFTFYYVFEIVFYISVRYSLYFVLIIFIINKYDNLSNDYHRLQHEYNIYDEDNLIHKYLFNKDTYYDENLNYIIYF